jgi:hypothetical protein
MSDVIWATLGTLLTIVAILGLLLIGVLLVCLVVG